MGKQNDGKKVKNAAIRYNRVVSKDTILRDDHGNPIEHMALMNRLGLGGGFVFAHGTPTNRQKKAH